MLKVQSPEEHNRHTIKLYRSCSTDCSHSMLRCKFSLRTMLTGRLLFREMQSGVNTGVDSRPWPSMPHAPTDRVPETAP
jgi:hypothetical protein